MTKYDKLVRDGIPARIEAKGEECRWHKAKPEELPAYLSAKLKEEIQELIMVLGEPSKAEEEIADVMEVVSEIVCRANLDEERLLRGAVYGRFGQQVDPEQYASLLGHVVQAFGTTFGDPEDLMRRLRSVMDAVDLLFLRGGLSPIAACLHMNAKREERGGFKEGIILDEAGKTG